MAAHSSVLAWRIPGMGEPGGLPSMGAQSRTRLKWLSSSSKCYIILIIFITYLMKAKDKWRQRLVPPISLEQLLLKPGCFLLTLAKDSTTQWSFVSASGGWGDVRSFGSLFFFTFYFILGYSQLTMLWQFQVNSEGTQPYLYPFSPKLPSHPGCHTALSSSLCYTLGPCWLPIFSIAVCPCPSQPPSLSLPPSFPLATIRLFPKSMRLFPFCKQLHLYHFLLDSMSKGYHMLFLLLCLTYFTQYGTL